MVRKRHGILDALMQTDDLELEQQADIIFWNEDSNKTCGRCIHCDKRMPFNRGKNCPLINVDDFDMEICRDGIMKWLILRN